MFCPSTRHRLVGHHGRDTDDSAAPDRLPDLPAPVRAELHARRNPLGPRHETAAVNIQWGLGVDGRCDLDRIADDVRAMGDRTSSVCRSCPTACRTSRTMTAATSSPRWRGCFRLRRHRGGRRRRAGPRHGPAAAALRQHAALAPAGRQVMRYVLPWERTRHRTCRVLIEAVVEAPSGPIRVMTTHLEWSSVKLRAAQVEGIREAHRTACERVASRPRPTTAPSCRSRARPARS